MNIFEPLSIRENRCLSALQTISIMAFLSFVTLSGCVSGNVSRPSTRVGLDDESMEGGITSADIRTVATKMCPSILSIPEIADGIPPVRIKIANMKNSSRFFIDRNLFMKRLSVELNRYGAGQVRFLNNNEVSNTSREAVLADRQSKLLQAEIKKLGQEIASAPIFANVQNPVKIAVIPVLNANLVNMNANSFAAMLRSEIANASAGKIQFLMPGETKGADYWLTGQFYPESMKTEGIINLADYIEVIDDRIRNDKSMYIETQSHTITPAIPAPIVTTTSKQEGILLEMLRKIQNEKKPNVNMHLNMMIVQPNDKVSVFEKSIIAEKRISDNSGAANYILSGEISGLTQSARGNTTDYLLITMQLLSIEQNEVLWEDAYEVKRATHIGVVYR